MGELTLALETATSICSVAITDKNKNVHHKSAVGFGVHSEKTLSFIDLLLKDIGATFSDVGIILVNKGPGSYTGLRIGTSLAKGLIFQKQTKLISLSTLEATAFAIAKEYPEAKSIHTVLNARRTHLYHQQFSIQDGFILEKLPLETRSLQEIESLVLSGDVIAGEATERLSIAPTKRIKIVHSEHAISALNMIKLYFHYQQNEVLKEENPETYEPIY